MIKETPNPPQTDGHTEIDSAFESRKPAMAKRCAPPMFIIAPGVNTETLLAHACETLASAGVMATELAFLLSGPKCNLALGILQMISLAELSVDRLLDELELEK